MGQQHTQEMPALGNATMKSPIPHRLINPSNEICAILTVEGVVVVFIALRAINEFVLRC